MKKRFFYSVLLFALVWGNGLFAQRSSPHSGYSIAGTVLNEQGTKIEYGNAVLLKPSDSSLVSGVLLKDGTFFLQDIHQPKLLLKLSALGYEPHFLLIQQKPGQEIINLDPISLRLLQAEAVEITAKKPLVIQRGTNMRVNIAGTSLESIGTAMDVIRTTPKVVIGSNGQISVLGRGNAIVYLDGQQVPSQQVLQALSSHEIKQIEVIENPSARFDAAGNAVIHIITKKGKLEGYRLGFVQEAEQGRFFRSYYKTEAYYRLPKLVLQASYGYRHYKRRGREFYHRMLQTDDFDLDIDNKFIYSRRNLNHELNLKGSYQLHPWHRMGFQLLHTSPDGLQLSENRNVFLQDQSLNYRLNTHIQADFDQKNSIINGFYEWQLDSAGSQISLSAQQNTYSLQRDEAIEQDLFKTTADDEFFRKSQNQNSLRLRAVQLDGEQVLGKGGKLAWGLKHARISNQGSLDFSNQQEDGSFLNDPHFSSINSYWEQIDAAYGEWSWNLKKWTAMVGLRSAWTRSEGLAEDQEIFSRNYIDFFPNLKLSYQVNKDNQLHAAYNYRIQRPQFQDLNPFVWYADSLVSLQGNPRLRPAYSSLYDLSWNHKGWVLKANYTHIRDQLNTNIRINDPENPAVFTFRKENIESINNYAITLSKSFSFGKYNAYAILGGRSEYHRFRDMGGLITNQKAGVYLYLNQSLQLPGDMRLELLYSYSSPRVDGIYTDRNVQFLNIGLSKSFIKNQLNVRLHANDIFDTYKFRGTAQVNDNDWTYLSEGDWRFVKLVLSWDFGKLSKQSLRQRKVSDSEAKRVSSM
jgi:hypothetical protein